MQFLRYFPALKKIFYILMLLPLGYTQWAYYGQFIIVQWQMKEAAREAWIAAQPDNAFLRVSLVTIETHGKWEERGKECWYQGHLYDVIRTRISGDTTWLFCLDDEQEEDLIRKNGEITRINTDHPDKNTSHTLCLRSGDLVCERPVWPVPPPGFIQNRYSSNSIYPLPAWDIDIVAPPPKREADSF